MMDTVSCDFCLQIVPVMRAGRCHFCGEGFICEECGGGPSASAVCPICQHLEMRRVEHEYCGCPLVFVMMCGMLLLCGVTGVTLMTLGVPEWVIFCAFLAILMVYVGLVFMTLED